MLGRADWRPSASSSLDTATGSAGRAADPTLECERCATPAEAIIERRICLCMEMKHSLKYK